MATASIGSVKSVLSEADLPPVQVLFGTTAGMEAVRLRIEEALASSTPLWIQGEDGVGKETIAKFCHLKSAFPRGPFVRIDCSASSTALAESKLLGLKSPLTRVNSSKPGRADSSRQATHFLHEVSNLELGIQLKLLQALQDRSSSKTEGGGQFVEALVISATSHDIQGEIRARTFREDLFRFLNGAQITLPPLRERTEDIPGLVDYLCAKYDRIFHRHTPSLSARVLDALQDYNWPGNIRELENILRRYVIFGQESLVLSDVSGHSEFVHIPDYSRKSDLPLKSITRQVKRELERKLILRALEDNQWSRKKAATTLKISYRALLYKIRGSGIPSLRNMAAHRHEGLSQESPTGAREAGGEAMEGK